MYETQFQTRLTNNYVKDNPCKCGVLLPNNISKCTHCTENDKLLQNKITRSNKEKYGLHAQAEKKLHAKKMGKRKYIGRGTR